MLINKIKSTLNVKGIFTLILALTISSSYAQYAVTKHTISNGGGTSNGINFQVSGTIGQSDAYEPISGGEYVLTGGFWASNIDSDIIFIDGFE